MDDSPEVPNSYTPVEVATSVLDRGPDGTCAAVLMLNGEPVITLHGQDPDRAQTRLLQVLAVGFSHLLATAAHALDEDDVSLPDDDDEDDPYSWSAAWAEDMVVGQLVKVPVSHDHHSHREEYDVGTITRIHHGFIPTLDEKQKEEMQFVGPIDPTVYAIYHHEADADCTGHHFYGNPRAAVWIAELIPTDVSDLTTEADA